MHADIEIAWALRERGITDANDVPLEIWLELHFLSQPTERFRSKVNAVLAHFDEDAP